MVLKFIEDLSTTTLKSQRFVEEEEDEQDDILDFYDKLFSEHIKLEKAKKKASKSLEEKENELSVLNVSLEENKSSVSYD